MRLVNTATLELEDFADSEIPQYAILSHTWRRGEVTYQDWANVILRAQKLGWDKIRCACEQAREHGYEHIWIDTCCINKESSAELSEAINSMYTWYQNAAICYAYLDDVYRDAGEKQLRECRWFTRGWTLQELIAPKEVYFYNGHWDSIGTKSKLKPLISSVTGIDEKYLIPNGTKLLESASISEKMSWAAHRKTARIEDEAYCLMGLFDVNMPLLYGEGEKAFIRLQEEIVRYNGDQTILSWMASASSHGSGDAWNGCFAPNPEAFSQAQHLYSTWESDLALTSVGLKISLPLLSVGNGALKVGALAVHSRSRRNTGPLDAMEQVMCLLLIPRRLGARTDVYVCSKWHGKPLYLPISWFDNAPVEIAYLHHARSSRGIAYKHGRSITRRRPLSPGYAVMPIFDTRDAVNPAQTGFLNSIRWAGCGPDNMTVNLKDSSGEAHPKLDHHVGVINAQYLRSRTFRADQVVEISIEIRAPLNTLHAGDANWACEVRVLEAGSASGTMLIPLSRGTQFIETTAKQQNRVVRAMKIDVAKIEQLLILGTTSSEAGRREAVKWIAKSKFQHLEADRWMSKSGAHR